MIRDLQAAIEASKLYVKAQDALRTSEEWHCHATAANVMQVVMCVVVLATEQLAAMAAQAILVLCFAVCELTAVSRLRDAERLADSAKRAHAKATGQCN